MYEDWSHQSELVILESGDMIVDILTNEPTYGVLLERVEDKTMEGTEMHFWKIKWSTYENDAHNTPNPTMMEECGLKMSIYVGFYDLYKKT